MWKQLLCVITVVIDGNERNQRIYKIMLSWCNKWAEIEIKIFILKKSGYNTKHDVLSWEPLAQ